MSNTKFIFDGKGIRGLVIDCGWLTTGYLVSSRMQPSADSKRRRYIFVRRLRYAGSIRELLFCREIDRMLDMHRLCSKLVVPFAQYGERYSLNGRMLICEQELAAITDQRVEHTLRSADTTARKWLAEDPSLQMLQRLGASSNGNGQ